MYTDYNLPPEFDAVKDDDEEILWTGTPNNIAFLLTGVPFLLLGLVWGSIDYFAFIRNIHNAPAGFTIPFFALHLFPFWGSILNIIRLYLVHDNTRYALSNKRLMMRSGFWGTDFKVIDYDKISDIDVNVNPIENMLGVGTLRAYSGRTSSRGGRIYDRFIGIRDPYGILKKIKEISVNVKTDWYYPNALRPDVNPGYNTHYKK